MYFHILRRVSHLKLHLNFTDYCCNPSCNQDWEMFILSQWHCIHLLVPGFVWFLHLLCTEVFYKLSKNVKAFHSMFSDILAVNFTISLHFRKMSHSQIFWVNTVITCHRKTYTKSVLLKYSEIMQM